MNTSFLVIAISTFLLWLNANSQSLSPSTLLFKHQIAKYSDKDIAIGNDEKLLQTYPISLHENKYYVSFLAETNSEFDISVIQKLGVRTGTCIENFIILRIPVDLISNDFQLPGISYMEIAPKIQKEIDRAIHDTSVDSVHAGINLLQAYTGKDVLIGITDWGFDYTHPMFYDTSLTYTRIERAWDQYKTSGPYPLGFDYGTEYTNQTELLNAQCDTFNIYEYATHGTHVAGIAAGSGAGTQYRGVAFDANLLLATFLIDAAAFIDAIYWMQTYANQVGKRLVINMSWGLYHIGAPDGTSILSQIMDIMSEQGVIFVTSAGNNGNSNFHIKHYFESHDTLKTQIKFDNYASYSKMWGQNVSMWGSPDDSFEFALHIFNSQNELIATTPFFNTIQHNGFIEDIIVIDTDTIFFNATIETLNYFNDRPNVQLRIRNTQTSKYKTALFATSDNCILHLWNVIDLTTGVGNWGSDFHALFPDWKSGDSYYSLGEPASTQSVITVGAYQSRYQAGNNFIGGQIAPFSSLGPTIDNRVKPDICAPGVNVCSSVSSFTSMFIPGMSVVASVEFNGRTYRFVRFSGTSMSSPVVAGIVALLLEANPLLTGMEIKEIIKETARTDSFTGNIPLEGDSQWGWGKVHALKAISKATGVHYSTPNIAKQHSLYIYPNPVQDKLHITFPECESLKEVFIYNTLGKLIQNENFSGSCIINTNHLYKGVYHIIIKSEKKIFQQTFIKM